MEVPPALRLTVDSLSLTCNEFTHLWFMDGPCTRLRGRVTIPTFVRHLRNFNHTVNCGSTRRPTPTTDGRCEGTLISLFRPRLITSYRAMGAFNIRLLQSTTTLYLAPTSYPLLYGTPLWPSSKLDCHGRLECSTDDSPLSFSGRPYVYLRRSLASSPEIGDGGET